MTLELVRDMLAWCTVLNMGLVLFWFLFSLVAHDWIYRLHSKWFPMPVEKFNAIHYASLVFFKIGIFLLNVVPYLALRIIA